MIAPTRSEFCRIVCLLVRQKAYSEEGADMSIKRNRACFSFRGRSIALVALAALVLGCVWDVRAQTVSGRIQGSVNDASAAAVPNAQITIANQDTGASRETMSTGDGVYSVPSLLPGKYSVSATAQGFSPAEVK